MQLVETLVIAVGLALDACAVSIAAGASGRVRGIRAGFRLSFHFGLFQALMPLAGWFLGVRVAERLFAVDHWVAFLLLGLVGVRMIRSGLDPRMQLPRDPSRGITLVMLSLATSIDAFAVGLSLAMLGQRIWLPSLVIGVTAAVFSVAGLAVGERLGMRFGRRMEIVGGAVLIGVGLNILLSHLLDAPNVTTSLL